MTRKAKTIVQKHKTNFETLKKACRDGNVALMDCVLKSTGEHVAAVCAVSRDDDEQFVFTPFTMFFNGNPFEMLISPMQIDEGAQVPVVSEYEETHQTGTLMVENLELVQERLRANGLACDFGVKIAGDGRVWVCVDGIAFLRFKRETKAKHV